MGSDENMSSLFSKLDRIIELLELQTGQAAPERSIGEKVQLAYMALAKFGPNYSAISRETGVHRNTLSKSAEDEWTIWRLYFDKLKSEKRQERDRRVHQGSKDAEGNIEAWD